MKPIQKFTVSPRIPEKLQKLRNIAYNLWWSWDDEARELFRRLDPDLWESSRNNPVLLLNSIDQQVLNARCEDESYLYQLNRVADRFEHMLSTTPWFQTEKQQEIPLNVAYFSMEYGITESLAIYSGGLGVLSGDHLKSSSELGIPLHAVGLSYQNGYFQQVINRDDWQEEKVAPNDFYNLPMTLVRDAQGADITVLVPLPGRTVYARIWQVAVGRINLYLLDTNIDMNSAEDRKITAELYGGDREMRIKQEILLGMGGVKALQKLCTASFICHMNEGHSAFSGLERIKILTKEHGLKFHEAREVIKASSIFTTHTPVKAGIDTFPPQVVEKYFKDYCREVNITLDDLLALGRRDPGNPKEEFSMAILAIKLSYKTNAVSELHGDVSRKMWRSLWPDVIQKEIPITSVTNGIHHESWVSKEMAGLYDRYFGPEWRYRPAGTDIWQDADKIPDGELWRAHARRREKLITFARRRLVEQYQNLGKPNHEIARVQGVLSTDALTIGFARRFATYKRALLIFSDPERLEQLLSNRERPVQMIIAGKAHPQDDEGKKLIQEVLKLSHDERFYQQVVFLENYDLNMARYLVQGCDLWLNNPRRGMEACGTSGMKVSANGILNFSTLDGWWDEIYHPDIGWAIGDREIYEDNEYWDKQEANILYNMLAKEIIPTFYYRDSDGLPRDWIRRMKNTIKKVCPIYNSNRMLNDYTTRLYYPAAERANRMQQDDFKIPKELAQWRQHMQANWASIRFLKVTASSIDNLAVDSPLEITAEIFLDGILPNEIELQVYYGRVDNQGQIRDGEIVSMQQIGEHQEHRFQYRGTIQKWESGLNGYTVRIIPKHECLVNPFEEGLIHWFEN